jgi:hypothetical protein
MKIKIGRKKKDFYFNFSINLDIERTWEVEESEQRKEKTLEKKLSYKVFSLGMTLNTL